MGTVDYKHLQMSPIEKQDAAEWIADMGGVITGEEYEYPLVFFFTNEYFDFIDDYAKKVYEEECMMCNLDQTFKLLLYMFKMHNAIITDAWYDRENEIVHIESI